jgi:hypothetical protein
MVGKVSAFLSSIECPKAIIIFIVNIFSNRHLCPSRILRQEDLTRQKHYKTTAYSELILFIVYVKQSSLIFNKKFSQSLIIFLSLILLGCNSDIVESEEKIYPPGTRNYSWETIELNEKAPLNTYIKLWGNEPNDIWVIGGAGDFDKTIIRYDGTVIKYYGKTTIDPRALFGFNKTDIWFGGSDFDIWKFNGNTLNKYIYLPLTGFVNTYFGDIWGDAPNNVLAVGSATEQSTGNIKGIILKYDGLTWKYVNEPSEEIFYSKIRRSSNDTKYYLVGIRVRANIPDSSDFYEFDGVNIKPIHVGNGNDPTGKSLTIMDDIVYFCYENEIYKKTTGGIQHFISLNDTEANGIHIWGRNENDFFVQSQIGIGHYNGNNLETIYSINDNFGILDGIILESDIYFLCYSRNTMKFFLVHGKKN